MTEVPCRPARRPKGMYVHAGRDEQWEQRRIGNLTTPDLNGPCPAPFSCRSEGPEGVKRFPRSEARVFCGPSEERSGAVFAPLSGATWRAKVEPGRSGRLWHAERKPSPRRAGTSRLRPLFINRRITGRE